MAVTSPDRVSVRIERLVVETDRLVDGFALQLALGEAIRRVVTERGLPASWRRDASVTLAVLGPLDWDGRSGETGLAQALAERLHEAALP